MATTQTRPTWSKLIGSNNWEGLLDPLDLNLRKLILRSGDFIQATYDAFNNDENSKYCGSSCYGKSSFFQKVMLENTSDYKVLFFLYGTTRVSVPEAFLLHSLSRESWDRESNWIGYIAVTSDEVARASGRRHYLHLLKLGATPLSLWLTIFFLHILIFISTASLNLEPHPSPSGLQFTHQTTQNLHLLKQVLERKF